MPGRDGTGPYSRNGRRMNGCRRDKPSRFYCQRNDRYLENDQTLLKNQAHYYEEELKRINSRLDRLNAESISSE